MDDSTAAQGDGIVPSLDAWQLGAEHLVGSIVFDAAICNYEGVDLMSVEINSRGSLDNVSDQPRFIGARKLSIPEPVPNRPKVHLVAWEAPIIDQGNVARFEVARSDFWTSVATKKSIGEIHAEIESGNLELSRLPRRLDVHLVVVCGLDNKLLLTLRGTHVDTEPGTWMASVGESMDWERDGKATVPSPAVTARYCLTERDELNLPDDLAEQADLRLVGLATEWTEMLANLIVVCTVRDLTFDGAKKWFRRGENVRLDAIDFTPEACAPLISTGRFIGSYPGAKEQSVNDISRAALLAAVRHRSGDDAWNPSQ